MPKLGKWQWDRFGLYLLGLGPGVWLFTLGLRDQLGADPLSTLERELGFWALRFLLAALAVTPIARLGGPRLYRYRRILGLLAFYYALTHLTVYLFLDHRLNMHDIAEDILKRPFIVTGMLAFTILVPLAVTSNNVAMRWLGGAKWSSLHGWVYSAGLIATVHFTMVAKVWTLQTVIYAAIMIGLLAARLLPQLGGRTKAPKAQK